MRTWPTGWYSHVLHGIFYLTLSPYCTHKK
jgi:hypothetical protein